jgi:hypothetical protein
MVPNPYLNEKALEVHRQALLHEAEVRRLLAQLPKRQNMGRRAAGKLGVLLVKLGMWLKQLEQPQVAFED